MSEMNRDALPDAAGELPGKLPKTFKEFVRKFPELGEAHQRVGQAVERLGPMDAKACSLVKIGISLGAGLESALRSHVRRAMQAGATEQEVEQAILLGMNTVGFPRTVAAWSWAQVQFERDRSERTDREASDDAGDR
ncbi:carboxymuconolactone decarboxylase family protein [Phycisphaerales bacterium AB-hyl4]|uniref:Carboxymuconolactone decarboxylase family protein n=1 Tax=Natronomicrosphaera hydrolytica TaxID=3242702 RepID=A0ABV4U1G2_9BACT